MKLAALVGVAALGVASCAPASNPPTIPVKRAGSLLVNVVDSLFDAGRSPSVVLDQAGQPAVAYLLYRPVLKKGQIPPGTKPGDPQPPSVILATFDQGIWTRYPIPPQPPVGIAGGHDPEIANANGQAVPGIVTRLALDAKGKHHVVWSTPSGLFYSTDAGGAFTAPDKVSADAAYGASVAVDSTGTAWIAFVAGGALQVAHGKPGSWTVNQAFLGAGPATDPAVATAIAVARDGRPVVAGPSQGRTLVAHQLADGTWASAVVSGSGGYGTSLALDKDGNPFVAYYDASGGVHVAHSIGGAQWQVTDLGSVAPATVGKPDARWSTGVAVDGQGRQYVTWADTSANRIVFASSGGGQFASSPVQASQGGTNPSLAVSSDGTKQALAWFDSTTADLDVAATATGGLALAHPLATLQQPSVGPTTATSGGPPPCTPSGTTLQITAQNTTFDTNCLAAPAGQAFTIQFTNNDAGTPHNVDIYDRQGGTHLGAAGPTDFFTGPGQTTYPVSALDAGTYYFQCDVHPTAMFGTFVVAKP